MRHYSSSPLRLILKSLPLILVGTYLAFPLVYAILGSFKQLSEFSYPPTFLPRNFFYFGNYVEVFRKTPIIRYFFNSLVIAVVGAFLELTFSILAAYAFAYLEFRGKKFFFFLIMGTLMLPGETLFVGNYLTVAKLGLLDTYAGVILPLLASATQILILRQAFMSLPKSLYEAAKMDGSGGPRYIFSILIPITKSFLVILTIRAFLSFWNAYLWPLLVTNSNKMRTVQVGITMMSNTDVSNFGLILAAVTIVLIPSLLFFIFAHDLIQDGLTSADIGGTNN